MIDCLVRLCINIMIYYSINPKQDYKLLKTTLIKINIQINQKIY